MSNLKKTSDNFFFSIFYIKNESLDTLGVNIKISVCLLGCNFEFTGIYFHIHISCYPYQCVSHSQKKKEYYDHLPTLQKNLMILNDPLKYFIVVKIFDSSTYYRQ